MISLIIPAFNEEGAILQTLEQAHKALNQCGDSYEIIVVNDGSTDGTGALLRKAVHPAVTVVHHNTNRGNGAALKTGIRHAKGNTLAIVDADGTYPISRFPDLYRTMQKEKADMVVGARRINPQAVSLHNRIGKWILTKLAVHLTQMNIPDINSGMRMMDRALVERFMHLFPDGFSSCITITLAALTNGYNVTFIPIDYFERVGKSKLSAGVYGPLHFMYFLTIIGRIILYFRPMRFFVAPSVLLCVLSLGTFLAGIITQNSLAPLGLIFLLAGIQLACFGLLADMIARSSQRNL
ncbi:hypothetical protein A2454_02800 [Candidatus Peribacteria bacterium RIFOXYC2_FULL_55_14]|nr:MAG: Glycosyl transferase, group 2 family domain protein [Candidatus Peribacteria bacterium GW2011_GWB1_54_5]KKW41006.1 MAG: Glycosyl transferase, group 2 family domain protein [Candidatus Peribacteria bacterium GW2011_GWC2_54_8]KKW41670.1 MAG: Glycosyl transferase, group 2 family domain protein [Candidatus Peregrinibacteria bacterium GW2011_GWA2_54_9]OGJ71102.1 MAG: hypothetical protein A2198_01180 [Candidatus Peribacteria bacterium RIFOXYA1_FULL_56_14]OGJ73736.1 MAG: hypothetical protein A